MDGESCWAVIGGGTTTAITTTTAASSILLPAPLLARMTLSLGDPVLISTFAQVFFGPAQLQPHSFAKTPSDEVLILTESPSRGQYDLPVAPWTRLPARLSKLRSLPGAIEVAIEASAAMAPIYVQKLIANQNMVVRPGANFSLRYPGAGLVSCRIVNCLPVGDCVITAKTVIQLCSAMKLEDNADALYRHRLRDCILGPAFIRLNRLLSLSAWRPKGILIRGGSGCGKSLIVTIAALSAQRSVSYISGADLAAMDSPGDAERMLAGLFEGGEAVICIDEIEAIAAKRSGRGSNRILGQLLTLMAGVVATSVQVIGLTSSPNQLDPAVRRPGRFDHEIEIPTPDLEQRDAILAFYLGELDRERRQLCAARCIGYTGADLRMFAQECALSALAGARLHLDDDDIAAAFRRVPASASLKDTIVKVPPTDWNDIGGCADIKRKLRRLIEWPILHPKAYGDMGLRPPRGALLYGPPGCAKTTLARALVSGTQQRWSILKLDAASVYSSFVGDAEAAIRKVFQQARTNLPCMILLDEIDAIVTSRGLSKSSGDQVQERVLSTLLNEIDGVTCSDQILVIGSTNRPQMLDEALLRPGRFDHLLYVEAPNAEGRLEILKVHTRSMPLSPKIDLRRLACENLCGYTGAEIENICREAALHALRNDLNAIVIRQEDLLDAIRRHRPALTPELHRIYDDFAKTIDPCQNSTNR